MSLRSVLSLFQKNTTANIIMCHIRREKLSNRLLASEEYFDEHHERVHRYEPRERHEGTRKATHIGLRYCAAKRKLTTCVRTDKSATAGCSRERNLFLFKIATAFVHSSPTFSSDHKLIFQQTQSTAAPSSSQQEVRLLPLLVLFEK